MARDMWINIDRFTENTKNLADIGTPQIEEYTKLSAKLGNPVDPREAILDAVANPEEFQNNLEVMSAEVAMNNEGPSLSDVIQTAFIGPEAAELGEAVAQMREGFANPEGNAAMSDMQKAPSGWSHEQDS